MREDLIDKIIVGDTLEVLKTFPDEFVDCVEYFPRSKKGLKKDRNIMAELRRYLYEWWWCKRKNYKGGKE